MKKIILVAIVFITGLSVAKSQDQGDIKVNGGLAFGTEAGYDGGGIGLNIGAEYFISDIISAAPSYTYFFEDSEGPFSARFSAINLDGRYYFLTDEIQVYGLLGLSILSINIKGPVFFGQDISVSDSETGLNVGGGILYPIDDKLGLNGQIKYQTPGDGQLVLNLGISYKIN